MGFVFVMLILFRMDRVHTRLVSLRAVNSSLPVGVLSVASFLSKSLYLSLLFVFSRVTAEHSAGPACCLLFSILFSLSASCLPLTFVFGSPLVFSSFSRPLSPWFRRSPSLFFSFPFVLWLLPRVSR